MIRFESSLWACWEKLPEAIRSGQPVRPPNMYQEKPTETEIFIKAMDSLVKARGDGEVIANAIDWSGITELLDVGSGPATYPITLCQRFPNLHAKIFDLPGTLVLTRSFVRRAGMQDRIELIAGDYRKDPIPGSYDLVFLSNIIHGEGEHDNAALVRKLASNLKLGGQLVVKDHILDDSHTTPPVGAIFSLLMLLTTESGRCYSFSEIKSWMEHASLSRVERIDLPMPLTSSLVIGVK
jgi:SAM-dependent methyltransferase